MKIIKKLVPEEFWSITKKETIENLFISVGDHLPVHRYFKRIDPTDFFQIGHLFETLIDKFKESDRIILITDIENYQYSIEFDLRADSSADFFQILMSSGDYQIEGEHFDVGLTTRSEEILLIAKDMSFVVYANRYYDFCAIFIPAPAKC